MRRLQKNLAKGTSFEEFDKDVAYAIWLVEKEFHVGRIDDDFPLLKFWNLFDEYNSKRYNKETDPKRHKGLGTMG